MSVCRDKKILITGGSSGIGKATALKCVREGATVAILAQDSEQVKRTVEELKAGGGKAFGYACDISDLNSVKMVIPAIYRDLGSIDVLINNAGYAVYRTFEESSIDEIDRLTRVNYLGLVYCSKLVLAQMTKARKGHVINVASVAGRMLITPNATYGAAKHGIAALTDLLRCEYAPLGIDFSLVLPGRVDTPFFDHETFKRRKARPENEGMLSADAIADILVRAIEKKPRQVFAPGRYRFAAWLINIFPWPLGRLLERLLAERIREHYDTVGWPSA